MEIDKTNYNKCLAYSVNALSRIMTKMADEEFASTGLTTSYAFLLMIVNEQPGINPGEISTKMLLNPSTVSRLIEKLQNRWYLERKIDGRITKVYPTQLSIDLDSQLKNSWSNLYRRYCAILGEKEASDLTNALFEATFKLI